MLKLEKAVCRVVKCITCLLQLEEEEARDSFDVDVAVTNPEKVGQCLFILHSFCFVKTMMKLSIISSSFILILFGK